MTMPDTEFFVALERKVWEALLRGDPQADAAMLEDGFLGVYETGFSDKAGHVGQLADGPSISEYRLHDARILLLGEGLVLLAYRAEFTRSRATRGEAMYVSSVWRQGPAGWRNIFSQDTAQGTVPPV